MNLDGSRAIRVGDYKLVAAAPSLRGRGGMTGPLESWRVSWFGGRLWSVVFGAMIPLGSLEAGVVAHFAGTPLALAFGAVICAASALVTLFVVRRREAQNAR